MAQSSAEPAAASGGGQRALLLRAVSGIALGLLALGAFLLGRPFFPAFICIFAILVAWEWGRLCSGRAIGTISAAVPAAVAAVAVAGFTRNYQLAAAIAVGAAPLIHLVALITRSRGPVWSGVGAAYLGLATVSMLWVYDRAWWDTVLWLALVVIATDTGAYFFGRRFGGPKLAPRISPSKTWSGLLGGVLCAAAAGLIFTSVELGRLVWLAALFGAATALIAQAGDLFESIVKRQFGVKDSSGIMPGHGGLLDRFDGLIAAVLAAAFALWVSGATEQG